MRHGSFLITGDVEMGTEKASMFSELQVAFYFVSLSPIVFLLGHDFGGT